jgi:hypothetical protein
VRAFEGASRAAGDRKRERGGRGGVMAPKRKTARSSKFADDAPWRAPQGEKPIPRISQGVVFPVRQGPNFSYAMSIMKHPDPIGYGLARECFLEPAGPDCIIPGQPKPIRLLGFQFWPLPFHNVISFKALEPIGRELKTVGKVLLSPPPPPPLVCLFSLHSRFVYSAAATTCTYD